MAQTKTVIIAPNVSETMGGEAIKAYHFYRRLRGIRPGVVLVAHARSRAALKPLLGSSEPSAEVRFVEDDRVQRLLWRSRVGRFLLDPYFHYRARAVIREIAAPDAGHVLHYLCPISPVAPRFPPRGYRLMIGPLNGNIHFPPAFRSRESRFKRISGALQGNVQSLLRLLGEKRRYHRVLVSGGERTRASLRRAGCTELQMVDVADSGVDDPLVGAEPPAHEGRNPRFVTSARLIDLKAVDLAIRAVAETPPPISLDVFGDGPSGPGWRRLAQELGVDGRVRFRGWTPHDELIRRLGGYRGFVFPTLAEANGIVMQEAMMAGLPVIALRWGGPANLANDESAVFIEPEGEAEVVAGLARAMTELADSPERATRIALAAREAALRRFQWPAVIAAWTAGYDDPARQAG